MKLKSEAQNVIFLANSSLINEQFLEPKHVDHLIGDNTYN